MGFIKLQAWHKNLLHIVFLIILIVLSMYLNYLILKIFSLFYLCFFLFKINEFIVKSLEREQLIKKLEEENRKIGKNNEIMAKDREKFATLVKATEIMVSSFDNEYIISQGLKFLKEVLDTHSIRILIPEDNYLIVKYNYGYDLNLSLKSKVKLGEGIAGHAAKYSKIIIVEDVLKDKRYVKELESTKAELAVPLIFQGELLGVLDVQNDSSFTWLEDFETIMDILVFFSNFLAMVLHNFKTYTQLKDSYLSVIKALANAIDAKDAYTHGHCERVKLLSIQIGKKLGLDKKDLEELEFSSLLHDIGKIGIPEGLLSKKGRLTKQEYAIVKTHPELGAEMIGEIPFLKRTKKIILQHHERVDGQGYPQGLKGEQIDFLAKIVSVADAVDAMLSNRSYRDAESIDYVINELDNCKGKQFEPIIAEVAKEILIDSK